MADDDPVDTGFEDVAAGNVYSPPEISLQPDIAVQEINPQPEITATVTPPATLTPEGVNAALALIPPLPKLDPPQLAQLAREIAMNIRERSTILKEFNLTDTQYDFLEAHNEFYKAALRAACIEWHAPLNTQERIKVEAAAILEDSLIGLGARMQNRAEGLPAVVEVAKLFAKVAGVGEREAGSAAPGERFVINIDLGGDTKSVTVGPAPAQEPAARVAGGRLGLPEPGSS